MDLTAFSALQNLAVAQQTLKSQNLKLTLPHKNTEFQINLLTIYIELKNKIMDGKVFLEMDYQQYLIFQSRYTIMHDNEQCRKHFDKWLALM